MAENSKRNILKGILSQLWFQILSTIALLYTFGHGLLRLILWFYERELPPILDIILGFLWAILIVHFLHTYRNRIMNECNDRIEKMKEDTIPSEVDKKVRSIRQLRKIDEPRRIMNILQHLLYKGTDYSFYKVFSDAGKGMENLQKDYLSRIIDFENDFYTFQELAKGISDYKELLKWLLTFIRKIEKLSVDFGIQRNRWNKDYNKSKMENLIVNYDSFIANLNSFYSKESLQHPGFTLMRTLLNKYDTNNS